MSRDDNRFDDATRFVHMKSDKRKWQHAMNQFSEESGLKISLSEWIRFTLNKAAEEQLRKK